MKIETLKTLSLNSRNASVSINSSFTEITYNWNVDWDALFPSGCPGRIQMTHEYVCNYPQVGFQNTPTNWPYRGYYQTYLMLSNLCGASYNSTTQNSNFLNLAKTVMDFEHYYRIDIVGFPPLVFDARPRRRAEPRTLIITNPTYNRQISITFKTSLTGPFGGLNAWGTAGIAVQGTDVYTGGVHTFTFVSLD